MNVRRRSCCRRTRSPTPALELRLPSIAHAGDVPPAMPDRPPLKVVLPADAGAAAIAGGEADRRTGRAPGGRAWRVREDLPRHRQSRRAVGGVTGGGGDGGVAPVARVAHGALEAGLEPVVRSARGVAVLRGLGGARAQRA